MIEHIDDPAAPRSHLPFSPAVKVGALLFVSGQASVDRTGAIVSDSFIREMRRSIENLRLVLEAAGSGLAHVVQTRNYVRDESDLETFNQVYLEFFTTPFPARTTITNCLGAALRYEIDCVAVVPGSSP